jgi:hypothetical protein
MIIQNVGEDGSTNLGFTVPENELEKAKESWLLSAKEFGMEVPEKIKYKRINITFPEKLLSRLDEVLKNELHMSRSAFFQQSVQQSLMR